MQLPTYSLYSTNSDTRYDFVSLGPKGPIVKQVRFALLHGDSVYNLAFGDFDPATQTFDDQVVSNNGDLELILATVAAAVYDFCRQHPGASLFAVGVTEDRTCLYRMAIAHHFDHLQAQCTIYGELGNESGSRFRLTGPTPPFSPSQPIPSTTTYENRHEAEHHRSARYHPQPGA